MGLPEKYKKGIPRVTNIVEYFYPFKGTEDEVFFLNWLKKNNIDEKKYMEVASELGTEYHNRIEDYILTGKGIIDKPIKIIIDEYRKAGRELCPEFFILDKKERYQGTADLVLKKGKRVIILDWKTWGIAKNTFGIKNTYRKTYKKIYKTFLQMSFYAQYFIEKGYETEELMVCEINVDGASTKVFLHSTSRVENIDLLLEKFNSEIVFKENDMIIEIRMPTEQYGFINVTVDLYKDDSGRTKEEIISEAIEAAKNIKLNLSK